MKKILSFLLTGVAVVALSAISMASVNPVQVDTEATANVLAAPAPPSISFSPDYGRITFNFSHAETGLVYFIEITSGGTFTYDYGGGYTYADYDVSSVTVEPYDYYGGIVTIKCRVLRYSDGDFSAWTTAYGYSYSD